ncbi:MAG: type II toxin-antitoxin system VapC family toxin [Dehalococcoidia bacterium]|nr:type II toxin-antitoxin system VapC family toxin [Dehalococcoidia bacterium]MYA51908.1 type II toxin-antitoxin system VapC family toxin [Dehalococcoidia bacterium]MYH68070.1 type II toxin-antitoxin system VapC family toxin [Dehalococcoidia bacterium]
MILLDTNIVSHIFNGSDLAIPYLERLRGQRALISFQTLEELWHGAWWAGWGERRQDELSRHLEHYEVVWVGPELVERCARLRTERKAAGRELPVADAWIAATALLLNCPLASRDHVFSDVPGLELLPAVQR